MKIKIRDIGIIGDGGWGTTLAIHLIKKNYSVKIWGPFPEYLARIRRTGYNPKFLPGIKIPSGVVFVEDLSALVRENDLLVFAVPSQYLAGTLKKMDKAAFTGKAVLSVIKGIDTAALKRMSEVIKDALGNVPFAALSGPTIAREVAQGIPSTAVIASRHPAMARTLQKIFNSENFRIYTNSDVIGVELGGSIKNIIAIACGVCDGLGFGTNAKAAILTRGLAEMARLGKALGAKTSTFSGLSGLGDLVTTCVSPQSRNRSVGERLGRGEPIQKILSSMDMVAEGVETVKAVYKLSQKYQVPMPIAAEVYNIIYEGKKPSQAVSDLMRRKMKTE